VLLGVLALPLSTRIKKYILTLASCAFYAAWDYRYLGLLAVISICDYIAAAAIERSSSKVARRVILVLGITSNIGILVYFKYANFFLSTAALVAGVEYQAMSILLPAGISFYTFKSMSYTIDVYRREIRPCESYLDYAMFITFFPELIAGPIVRASVFLPQMQRNPGLKLENFATGLSLFLVGLIKKRLFADRLAESADQILQTQPFFLCSITRCRSAVLRRADLLRLFRLLRHGDWRRPTGWFRTGHLENSRERRNEIRVAPSRLVQHFDCTECCQRVRASLWFSHRRRSIRSDLRFGVALPLRSHWYFTLHLLSVLNHVARLSALPLNRLQRPATLLNAKEHLAENVGA
jgi:hypothetical protein